jgi:hypothetical protein
VSLDLRGRLVLTVPEAGRLLWGIGRDAAYDAAERGEIPARKVGRRLVVPTHAALSALGWSEDLIARALGIDPEHTETAPSQDAATATDSRAITPGALHEAWPAQPSESNVRALSSR